MGDDEGGVGGGVEEGRGVAPVAQGVDVGVFGEESAGAAAGECAPEFCGHEEGDRAAWGKELGAAFDECCGDVGLCGEASGCARAFGAGGPCGVAHSAEFLAQALAFSEWERVWAHPGRVAEYERKAAGSSDVGEVGGEPKGECGAELEGGALTRDLAGARAEIEEAGGIVSCADAALAEEVFGAERFNELAALVGDGGEPLCGFSDGAVTLFVVEFGGECAFALT